jgi:hypothetical protein
MSSIYSSTWATGITGATINFNPYTRTTVKILSDDVADEYTLTVGNFISESEFEILKKDFEHITFSSLSREPSSQESPLVEYKQILRREFNDIIQKEFNHLYEKLREMEGIYDCDVHFDGGTPLWCTPRLTGVPPTKTYGNIKLHKLNKEQLFKATGIIKSLKSVRLSSGVGTTKNLREMIEPLFEEIEIHVNDN